MMPFGVADRWADYFDENKDTRLYPNDASGTTQGSTLQDAMNGWSPNDHFQGPSGDVYHSPVSYPNGQDTGWTVQGDFGRQLVLKFGAVGGLSSGWANLIDLVGSNGGNDIKTDLETCNKFPISIAKADETCVGYGTKTTADGANHGCISIEPGGTQGPTMSGVGTIVGRDPGAHWSTSAQFQPGVNGAIVDSSGNIHMDSTRIRPLVVFDINQYVTSGCNGGNPSCVTKVANIIGFFVEGMCKDVTLDYAGSCDDPNKDVVGRIVTLPADFVSVGGTIASNATFLKTVMLVR